MGWGLVSQPFVGEGFSLTPQPFQGEGWGLVPQPFLGEGWDLTPQPFLGCEACRVTFSLCWLVVKPSVPTFRNGAYRATRASTAPANATVTTPTAPGEMGLGKLTKSKPLRFYSSSQNLLPPPPSIVPPLPLDLARVVSVQGKRFRLTAAEVTSGQKSSAAPVDMARDEGPTPPNRQSDCPVPKV